MNHLGEAEDTGNPTIQRHDSSQKGIHQGNSESRSPSPMGLGAEITDNRGNSTVLCFQHCSLFPTVTASCQAVADGVTRSKAEESYGKVNT